MKDVYHKCDNETIRKFVEIYEKYFPTIPVYVPTGRGLNQGASPLHLAVYAGDFRAVRFVISAFQNTVFSRLFSDPDPSSVNYD